MLHGTRNTPMDAEPWDLKPGNCPAWSCFNLLANPVNCTKKKHPEYRINLELFPTLVILRA